MNKRSWESHLFQGNLITRTQDVIGFLLSQPPPGQCWSRGSRKDQVTIQYCFGGERREQILFIWNTCLVLKRALDNFLNYFVQECMCIRNLLQGPGQWRLVKITLLNFSKFSVVNSFRWTSLIWETWCNEMLLRCFILNAVFNTGFPASVKGNLINVAFMLACLVSLCFDLIWIVVLLNKTEFFFLQINVCSYNSKCS